MAAVLAGVRALRHRGGHGQLPRRGGLPGVDGRSRCAADDRRRVRPVVRRHDRSDGPHSHPAGQRHQRRRAGTPHRGAAVAGVRPRDRVVQRHPRGEDLAPQLHRDAGHLLHADRGQARLLQAVHQQGARRRPRRGRGLRVLERHLRCGMAPQLPSLGRAQLVQPVAGPRRDVGPAAHRRDSGPRDRDIRADVRPAPVAELCRHGGRGRRHRAGAGGSHLPARPGRDGLQLDRGHRCRGRSADQGRGLVPVPLRDTGHDPNAEPRPDGGST